MTTAERIRAKRKALGLSQVAVADRSGVHVISIVRIEGGRPPKPETLSKLAAALGCTVSELVAGDASSQPAA